MRLAVEQIYDDFCPQQFDAVALIPPLFDFRPNYENLTLFYNCSDYTDIPVRNTFNCSPNNGFGIGGFFSESPIPASVNRNSQGCSSNITVPVLVDGVEGFRNNGTMRMRDLLNYGFEVDYRLQNPTSCLACEHSGGICWINSTISQNPTCLCRDRIHRFTCPNPGTNQNLGMKLGLGVGSAVLSAVIFTYIFCCIRRSSYRSLFFWRKMNKIDTKVEDLIRQQGQYNPKRYSYSEIKKITNFFKDELGKGGYGSVYKGALPDGRVVAVKILNTTKGNGEEFINEVSSIGRTSHINVVTLLGFCYNGEKRALVYEYMSNGSLDKYIYNRDLYLGGEMLYDIALGVARGLEYLHRGCNTRILHFDIKPHNILLDQEFRPKIADFGLAKMSCGKDSIVSMAGTRGTIGYIAPEVFSRSFGKVSHKSDVYSYGMLLIEMVGGKNKYDEESENISDVHFPHSVYKRIEPEEEVGFEKMLLVEENELTKRMLVVGLWCIQTDPVDRPPMNKVIEMLGGSLEDLPIPPKPFLFSPPRSPPVFYSSNTNSTAKSDLFS